MGKTIFTDMGNQIRNIRTRRDLTQFDLASRVGRNPARISELERDLLNGRMGRDRLTLFAEICDALDVAPVLVPRSDQAEVTKLLNPPPQSMKNFGASNTAFDDVFVDLTDDEEL